MGIPVTQGGITYFATNQAGDTSGLECSLSFGTARTYAIDCATGRGTWQIVPGGGFPASPTPAVIELADGTTVQGILFGPHVAGGTQLPRRRQFSYWYRSGLDVGR